MLGTVEGKQRSQRAVQAASEAMLKTGKYFVTLVQAHKWPRVAECCLAWSPFPGAKAPASGVNGNAAAPFSPFCSRASELRDGKVECNCIFSQRHDKYHLEIANMSFVAAIASRAAVKGTRSVRGLRWGTVREDALFGPSCDSLLSAWLV